MQQVMLSWFPSRWYANLYGAMVLIVLLADQLVPLWVGAGHTSLTAARDRGSFALIYVASLLGLGAGLYLRYAGIGVVPFAAQVLALVLLLAGALLREWAIVLLGRSFSRTVAIRPGQQLVTTGPFRMLRHPAYTGMLIIDTAIVLGLGTWVGALIMLVLLSLAAAYRIQVEERALLEAFGEQYRAYMQHTHRLLPLW